MQALARSARQIGAVIRRQRKLKQLSQTELARQLGVRQATISALETGTAGTRLSTLLDVLAALDLELSIGARSQGPAIEDIF